MGAEPNLMDGNGAAGLLAVLVAAAAFLVIETVLFHGSAYLNHAADEAWLRHTLGTPSFYLTEAGVLFVGGLSAAIWTGGGWFALLLAPVFLVTQQAALHEPLRERADHDDKTSALRFVSWRRLAIAAADRCERRGRPWCVLFADLDHFREFNETWGHLVGDDALTVVAEAIRGRAASRRPLRAVRRRGVLRVPAGRRGRRCRRHRRTDPRRGVGRADPLGETGDDQHRCGRRIAAEPQEFVSVLAAADRALYRAKREGRNRTSVVPVEAA